MTWKASMSFALAREILQLQTGASLGENVARARRFSESVRIFQTDPRDAWGLIEDTGQRRSITGVEFAWRRRGARGFEYASMVAELRDGAIELYTSFGGDGMIPICALRDGATLPTGERLGEHFELRGGVLELAEEFTLFGPFSSESTELEPYATDRAFEDQRDDPRPRAAVTSNRWGITLAVAPRGIVLPNGATPFSVSHVAALDLRAGRWTYSPSDAGVTPDDGATIHSRARARRSTVGRLGAVAGVAALALAASPAARRGRPRRARR